MDASKDEIKQIVRDKYAQAVKSSDCGCSSSCCGVSGVVEIKDLGQKLDYSKDELTLGPGEANLGLGCGNPVAEAGIKPGETIVDLGSGAGFDSFLSSKATGKTGSVIGVDMTPEMINKANELGADAVVNVRFTTSQTMAGAAELLAYGTAIKYKK